MSLGVEGAGNQDPLEPAPGGCSKRERAVQGGMDVSTVPAGLRCAVAADDRVVASYENRTPGAVRESVAAMIQDEMNGKSCATRLCELAAGRTREGEESLGNDGSVPVAVNGPPENGGSAGDLGAVCKGGRAIVSDFKAKVARTPGDGVGEGGVNLDGSTGRDVHGAD